MEKSDTMHNTRAFLEGMNEVSERLMLNCFKKWGCQ